MTEIIDKVFGPTFPGLKKALDLRWKRNEALTSNIANAETPGYRAVDVNFGSELDKAFQSNNSQLQKTNSRHIDLTSESRSHVVADNSGVMKADGNNVDLDLQMGRLSLNSGKYSSTASLVRKKIQIMRMAIRQSMR